MARTADVIERMSSAAGAAAGQAQAVADWVAPAAERSLIRRAMDLPLRKQVQLVRRLWHDPRISAAARVPALAGLAYAVLPLRLTPKALGPVRQVERVAGLGLLLWLLVRLAPRDVLIEHLDRLDRPGLFARLRHRGDP